MSGPDAAHDGIPEHLRGAQRRIEDSSLFLLRVDAPPVGEVQRRFAGSGTLVTHKGVHYLLTARHVWSEVLEGGEFIGVNIAPRGRGDFFRIPTLTVIETNTGPCSSVEWGPDLVLLRIHDHEAAAIEARPRRIFYNLDASRDECLRESDDEAMWCLIGGPGELVHVGQTEGDAEGRAYWSEMMPEAHERDGFDYLDFDLKQKDTLIPPSSYAGMSGSGLWEVRKGALDSPLLVGVAFCQSADRSYVRCHGPKSVYERLLSHVPDSSE